MKKTDILNAIFTRTTLLTLMNQHTETDKTNRILTPVSTVTNIPF